MSRAWWSVCVAMLVLGGTARSSRGEDPSVQFEAKVRPLLADRCWRCHGPEQQKGGLRLDSAEALARGGDAGPVVVPGKPEESRLVEVVRYASDIKMPPKGRLTEPEVAALVAWVSAGAAWPAATPVKSDTKEPDRRSIVTDEDRAFWAFQPVRPQTPPRVRDASWPANAIDLFVLARLEAAGLRPAPEADRRTLIRRVTFDLTGLPPSPEEVAAFVADDRPDAYARLVDRLLASPAHGERWGRHWLDLARYADTNGMDENVAYANAWRYRDYVVRAFNADVPFDRFLSEQIAGDLIPAADEPARHEAVTGTGFLVLGPKMLAEDDPVKMEMDIIDEQVDTVGKVFLGLTLGCARCHDHKFDPVPSTDYYGLAGIFKSTRSMANHKVVAMWNERPLASASEREAVARHKKELADAEKAVRAAEAKGRKTLEKELRERVADYLLAARETDRARRESVAREQGLASKLVERWHAALAKARDDASSVLGGFLEAGDAEKAKALQAMFTRAGAATPSALEADPELARHRRLIDDPSGPFAKPGGMVEAFLPAEDAARIGKLRETQKEVEAKAPAVPEAMAVEEGTPTDLEVHIRGSHLALGPLAPRHFPVVMSGASPVALAKGSSGRRELAEWLTRPEHPLTPRVAVNRIWLGHFGQGLVRTADNFGRLGEPPTHPELLDWLAARLIESGWSMKAMHRLIALSSTYRMSSRLDASAAAADPENRLLWRFGRRRLEAEAIRDAILAVSGDLSRKMGGDYLRVKNHAYVNSTGASQREALYDHRVRSVYIPVIRSGLYPVFQAFDFADPSASIGQRAPTTVAPQALFLLNDTLVLRSAADWARRLRERTDLDDAGRVSLAYESAYARAATPAEVERALAYLGRFEQRIAAAGTPAAERSGRAWAALCQAILAASEFMTID